jgi:Flp pilus assembly protein TadG
MMSETSQRKSSSRRPWQGLGDDQGSALVEFAFVLIVALTFMFGIMDFSRFLYTDHFLSGAAREGTRYAMVRGSSWGSTACVSTTTFSCNASAANVISYVQGLTPPGITASSLTVLPTWPGTAPTGAATACSTTKGSNSPGCLVQVQVSYPYKFLFPFLPKSTWTIASTSQMVVLQ